MKQSARVRGAGLGVDSTGGPVIDPTKNVEDLVQANKEHVDDMLDAAEKLANVRFQHVEFVAKLRASHEKEWREAAVATRNEDRKIADDAIRQLAAQTESLRQTLSKQVQDTAETLSKAKQESDRATEIRIAALERSSYLGAGEKSVSDPALVKLAESVAALATARTDSGGERRGATTAFLTMKELVLFALAVGAAIVAFLK
jgi:hypothetical protein